MLSPFSFLPSGKRIPGRRVLQSNEFRALPETPRGIRPPLRREPNPSLFPEQKRDKVPKPRRVRARRREENQESFWTGIHFWAKILLTERTLVVARLIAPLYPKGAKLRYSPAPPLQNESWLSFWIRKKVISGGDPCFPKAAALGRRGEAASDMQFSRRLR